MEAQREVMREAGMQVRVADDDMQGIVVVLHGLQLCDEGLLGGAVVIEVEASEVIHIVPEADARGEVDIMIFESRSFQNVLLFISKMQDIPAYIIAKDPVDHLQVEGGALGEDIILIMIAEVIVIVLVFPIALIIGGLQ